MAARVFYAWLLLCIVVSCQGKLSREEIDQLTDEFIEKIRPYRDEIKDWAYALAVDGPSTRAEYLTCSVCHPALTLARPMLENGGPEAEEELTRAIARVCMILNLAPSDDICYATIEGYVTPIAYMILNDPEMSNDDFCGFINEDCGTIDPEYYSWSTNVAEGKPEYVEPPPLPANVGRREGSKILHFTDLHVDLDYKVGTSTECVYPICCRDMNGPAPEGVEPAGKYGHGRCGLPYDGLVEMFEHAKGMHRDVRYILLTGDYIHSGVWLYNRQENERVISSVTQALATHFPGIPVIVVTGNHETPTVNMYPPPSVTEPEFSLTWMYMAMSDPFKQYFGSDEELYRFNRGGFYTVSPEPGLRFVILNSNICYIQNFWLPYEARDPFGQLDWFSKTMAAAEAANEKVLLVMHIPPGSGACWPHYSHQMYRIIDRYAHIITFQVYGHVHNEFHVVTMDSDITQAERPVSVGFCGPSAVPDKGAGIGYKVYYVDGKRGEESTWELIDHETWMLNITASHMDSDRPDWFLEYSASQKFNLTAHRPADYYNLTLRMIEDKELFEEYRNIYRKSNNDDNGAPCPDINCVNEIICDQVSYNSADRSHCDKLKAMVEQVYNPQWSGDVAIRSSLSSAIVTIFTAIVARFVVL